MTKDKSEATPLKLRGKWPTPKESDILDELAELSSTPAPLRLTGDWPSPKEKIGLVEAEQIDQHPANGAAIHKNGKFTITAEARKVLDLVKVGRVRWVSLPWAIRGRKH